MKKHADKKAYQVITMQPSIKMPYHASRFFTEGSRQIDFAGDQLSLGEDFGSLQEVRSAVEWLVDQLGGKVKWELEDEQ